MKSVLVGIILISLSAEAGWKQQAREYSSKYLGEKWTNKIFGQQEAKSTLELPSIPKVIPKVEIKEAAKITSFDGLSSMSKRMYFENFVRELSYVTRGIRIDEAGLKKWLNVLEQGGSQEGIYRAMVLDKTYQNLEEFQDPINNKVISFLSDYGSRFINQNYSEQSLRESSIYTIKRIVTERTLELIDYLKSKPEDLYRWYAIFSAEVSKELRTQNQVRSISDEKYHYRWAEKVPLQHIKGEVIIKLHEILNQFNEKLN